MRKNQPGQAPGCLPKSQYGCGGGSRRMAEDACYCSSKRRRFGKSLVFKSGNGALRQKRVVFRG